MSEGNIFLHSSDSWFDESRRLRHHLILYIDEWFVIPMEPCAAVSVFIHTVAMRVVGGRYGDGCFGASATVYG